MSITRIALAVLASVTLICPISAFAQKDGRISNPASLRDVLPPDAVGYMRIPDLWGFLGAPKQNVLDEALSDEANKQAIAGIRSAFSKNVLDKMAGLDNPVMSLFFEHLRSPVEIAFLMPEGGVSPIPMGLISMDLDFSTTAEFNEFMRTMFAGDPSIIIAAEPGPQSDGQILAAGMSAFYRHKPSTGNVRMLVFPGLNQTMFDKVMSSLEPTANHPMTEIERQIDTSGYGYFAWLNIQQAAGMMEMTMPPSELLKLKQSGVLDMRSVGFGWGVSNGRGRLRIAADMPVVGFRKYFWSANNELDFKTTGNPRLVFVVSSPNSRELRSVLARVDENAGLRLIREYDQKQQAWLDQFGINADQFLDAFGPDLAVVIDDVGEYGVMRIRDEEKKDRFIKSLVEKNDVEYTTHRYKRRVYHHLAFAGTIWSGDESKPPTNDNKAFLKELLQRVGTHIYWTEEDGYMIQAKVPQMLIDRHKKRPNVSVSRWLKETQRHDLSNSLMGLSGSLKDSPRFSYYMYLSTLELVADLVDYDLDLFTFPTAADVDLRNLGTFGLKFDVGAQFVAAELAFENNPIEPLLGESPIVGAAVVGILAAIAIPAYQDYTIRAQVAEGLSLAAGAKAAVAEYSIDQGVAPNSLSEAGLVANPTEIAGKYVESVDVVDGVIVITYGNQAHQKIQGTTLTLTPHQAAHGSVVWQCGYAAIPYDTTIMTTAAGGQVIPLSPTIPVNYMPAACR